MPRSSLSIDWTPAESSGLDAEGLARRLRSLRGVARVDLEEEEREEFELEEREELEQQNSGLSEGRLAVARAPACTEPRSAPDPAPDFEVHVCAPRTQQLEEEVRKLTRELNQTVPWEEYEKLKRLYFQARRRVVELEAGGNPDVATAL
eukprot:tig00020660_g12568.t1